MKIFNEKNEVIGQVVQDENSYRVSWLAPKGYYSEGNFLFIGEYQTQDLAIQKLHEFLDKRQNDIKIYQIKRDEVINKCNKIDRFFMITIYSFIAIAVIIILLLFCKL
jgi:hypothetical protein